MPNTPSQARQTPMQDISLSRFAVARFAVARFAVPRFVRPRFAATRCAALALLALSGCSTASYPSLARRAAETRTEPASAPNPAQTNSATDQQRDRAVEAQITALLAAAAAADAQFKTHAPRTEAALATPSRPGTEGWSTANIALAELERDRGALGRALADVEQIYAEDRVAHALDDAAPRALAGRIAQARLAVEAMATAQDTILARLRARLG